MTSEETTEKKTRKARSSSRFWILKIDPRTDLQADPQTAEVVGAEEKTIAACRKKIERDTIMGDLAIVSVRQRLRVTPASGVQIKLI